MATTKTPGATMPKVQVNGIEIYYEVRGSGEPLLLIAGFACDLTIWSLVAPSLASKYRVITFDNRGVGRSSAPDRPYSIQQMAEDASGLLDQLDLRQAHVAGHSMGGQIAQELALTHPEKVRSLMLLASCAKPDERNRAIIESWGELPRQVDAVTGARLSLPWIYTHRFYARSGVIEKVIDLIAANPFPPTPHGIFHQSRAVSQFDALARVGSIHCPTLVLVGREDILLPLAFSEELTRGIPGAELGVLGETGHGLLIESPEPVAQAMLGFVAKQSARM
jgi:pimeloyl-ACP methyl ester carboxylesterase